MNKKTIKKALLLTVCAILLVVASVMGTLAYLTSTDVVNNTFSVGQVKIVLDEAKTNAAGKPVKIENSNEVEVALAEAPRVKTNDYHLIPSSTYSKDPIVHIDEDSETCYVFIKVTNNLGSNEGAATIDAQILGNNWAKLAGHDNVYFKVWEKGTVDTDLETFTNFTVAATATNDSLANIPTKTIVVNAYAIQKENVATEADAWAILNP